MLKNLLALCDTGGGFLPVVAETEDKVVAVVTVSKLVFGATAVGVGYLEPHALLLVIELGSSGLEDGLVVGASVTCGLGGFSSVQEDKII